VFETPIAGQNQDEMNRLIQRRVQQHLRLEKDHQLRSLTNVLRIIHKNFYASLRHDTKSGTHEALKDSDNKFPLLELSPKQSTNFILDTFQKSVLRGCCVAFRQHKWRTPKRRLTAMVNSWFCRFICNVVKSDCQPCVPGSCSWCNR